MRDRQILLKNYDFMFNKFSYYWLLLYYYTYQNVLLTRISQIDHNFTHLGHRFWYKNQYIAVVLGLGHGVPDG